MYRILISNDDGIDAPGLRTLCQELSKMGEIYVVAPEGERSSNSHHLTIAGNIRYEKREIPGTVEAYALWGTPADCVYAGLNFFFKDKIDLVVSGINRGENVSSDIIYSGTVGAAREAYLQHFPSIATSVDSFVCKDYTVAAYYTRIIAELFMKQEDKTSYFLNINTPYLNKKDIKGIRICDSINLFRYDNDLSTFEKGGNNYISISDTVVTKYGDRNDLNIDVNALRAGFVVVSALHDSPINKEKTAALSSWINDTIGQ
jgi:5'-nucleotidase